MPIESGMGRAIYTNSRAAHSFDRSFFGCRWCKGFCDATFAASAVLGGTHASYPDQRRAEPSRLLVARGELPHRRADLFAGESSLARAAPSRAHQAAAARTLGHLAGP